MGLSIATGAAFAARRQKSSRRVFALLSDAELNSGAVWEAAMFACHHRLSNLNVIVDANGQQAFGMTKDILDLEPLQERWASFGWITYDVDGHDVDAISRALHSDAQDYPKMVVARTVAGMGQFVRSRSHYD